MDRPWIEAGLKYAAVSEHDLPCLLVQRVARLRARKDLDQRYLRYIIGSANFTNYILGVQTGTAVPHISGNQIKQFKFFRPSLPEQQAIASVLGALDDKIELNRA
ncbi:MAG: restriction endonuclease subunit S [Chloroflexota bacterium]|nr:restriction endonuclease subunit S [Chloroflexota bacterium]